MNVIYTQNVVKMWERASDLEKGPSRYVQLADTQISMGKDIFGQKIGSCILRTIDACESSIYYRPRSVFRSGSRLFTRAPLFKTKDVIS